jgi:hypothetical protein
MDGAPGQDEGELGRVDGTGEESWYVAVLPFPYFSLPPKSNSPLPSSRPTPLPPQTHLRNWDREREPEKGPS